MPHISEITDQDAIDAARLTGLPFDQIFRYHWGISVMAVKMPVSFCFHFKREHFECGMPGLLTPNIHLIVDFLRDRGYDLDKTETHGILSIQKEKIGSGV